MSARCAPGEGQCGDRQGAAARRGWGHGWHMRCWGWTLQTREQRLSLALLLLTPHLPLLQLMRFCPGAPHVPVAPEAPCCAQSSLCSAGPGLAPAHSPQLSPRHSGVQLAASASLWGQEPQPGAPTLLVAQSSVPRPTPLGWGRGSCLQQPQQREVRPPFPHLLHPAPLPVCLLCLQAQSISTHWAIGEVNSSSVLGPAAAEPRGQPWGQQGAASPAASGAPSVAHGLGKRPGRL